MNENLLKSIVIILGLLIIGALGVLVYSIATKAPNHIGSRTPYDVTIAAPAGYELQNHSVTDSHLILHFQNDRQDSLWRIYNLNNGRPQGVFATE